MVMVMVMMRLQYVLSRLFRFKSREHHWSWLIRPFVSEDSDDDEDHNDDDDDDHDDDDAWYLGRGGDDGLSCSPQQS